MGVVVGVAVGLGVVVAVNINLQKPFDNVTANNCRNILNGIENLLNQIDRNDARYAGFRALLVCQKMKMIDDLQERLGVQFVHDWRGDLG